LQEFFTAKVVYRQTELVNSGLEDVCYCSGRTSCHHLQNGNSEEGLQSGGWRQCIFWGLDTFLPDYPVLHPQS